MSPFNIAGVYPEQRVMGHLPKMAIRVFVVTAVATPENSLRLLDPRCTRCHCLRHKLIDFVFRRDVV
jgi:hypothetical protein